MNELEDRIAVSITVKSPFQTWLQTLPSPSQLSLAQINQEPSIYLVPDRDFDELSQLLKGGYWESIFEHELENWWADPEDWPADRDFDAFVDYFDVTIHGVIIDLAENWDGYDNDDDEAYDDEEED